jgi:hypothetical protein
MTHNPTKGKGKAYLLLKEHVSFAGDECLPWPFGVLPNGYGRLGYLGEGYYAHRFMCQLAHGDPPRPRLDVRHTCGNGNQGCVNPNHLEWGTRSQNLLDQSAHGRGRDAWWGHVGKLKPEQVIEIRALKGSMTAIEIAKRYPVITANTVRMILRGDSWKKLLPTNGQSENR